MKSFHILALETSGARCELALLSQIGAQRSIKSASAQGQGEHSRRILSMVGALLAEAGIEAAALSAVAFGHGPGGFTGLRVACAVAQGLALGLDIPVVPIDSLAAIAHRDGGAQDGVHVVLQDARMGEVYAAAYRQHAGGWEILQEPSLVAGAEVPEWLRLQLGHWGMQAGAQVYAHGDALAVFPLLASQLEDLGLNLPGAEFHSAAQNNSAQNPAAPAPSAAVSVAILAAAAWQNGQHQDAAEALPSYVRNKIAYTSAERALGLGGNPQAASLCSLHRIQESDIAEMAALEQRLQAWPWTLENFASGLRAGYHGWVLRALGALQAYALLLDGPDMAHLLVLGVRPESQGSGLGARLLQECIAYCQGAKIPALSLEVRQSNTKAIALYRKLGFVSMGMRRAYYPAANGREDALIMTYVLPGN